MFPTTMGDPVAVDPPAGLGVLPPDVGGELVDLLEPHAPASNTMAIPAAATRANRYVFTE
jgi:hypothetical protein